MTPLEITQSKLSSSAGRLSIRPSRNSTWPKPASAASRRAFVELLGGEVDADDVARAARPDARRRRRPSPSRCRGRSPTRPPPARRGRRSSRRRRTTRSRPPGSDRGRRPGNRGARPAGGRARSGSRRRGSSATWRYMSLTFASSSSASTVAAISPPSLGLGRCRRSTRASATRRRAGRWDAEVGRRHQAADARPGRSPSARPRSSRPTANSTPTASSQTVASLNACRRGVWVRRQLGRSVRCRSP